jgi:alcohol dehydrogenase YqhD (iron-dependent ADH family)
MENFIYNNPTKILFGRDTEKDIGAEIVPHAERVLLHYGKGSAERSGLLDRVRRSLEGAGITYYELGGVQPNPRVSLVYEGIDCCKKNGIGLVLAVGGGSVIDSAKAIAAGAPNSDNVWDYFCKKSRPKAILPIAAVLTIPGAGSESSGSAVITNEETKEKLDYMDGRLRPVISVLNPELTVTVDPYYSAMGVADAMAHIMETYFTNTSYVDVTDRMCEGVLKSLVKYGYIVTREPDNYDVRAEIMWAGKMAIDGTLGAGRTGDWGSHYIEHEVSAIYDVAHAAGLTAVLPAWMEYTYRHNRNMFIKFAMRVFNIEYDPDDPDITILKGIESLKSFFAAIGLPVSMRELGIKDRSGLDKMAENAARHGGGSIGNFVKLEQKDIREILERAF